MKHLSVSACAPALWSFLSSAANDGAAKKNATNNANGRYGRLINHLPFKRRTPSPPTRLLSSFHRHRRNTRPARREEVTTARQAWEGRKFLIGRGCLERNFLEMHGAGDKNSSTSFEQELLT